MMSLKKSILLTLSAFVLVACSTDDDVQPTILTTKATVLKAELPDSLSIGENYRIEVFYELPSACHMDVGLIVNPGSTNTESYIYGVAAYDADQVGCDQTSTDLQRSGEFQLHVESEETHVFHVWRGFDQDGKDIYEAIEVEVVM